MCVINELDLNDVLPVHYWGFFIALCIKLLFILYDKDADNETEHTNKI